MSLPKQFPLFILASSVCRCLQCLISALTQGGGGGPLFRLTCSVLLWAGRKAADNHWRAWGALAVSQPHWVWTAHVVCAFLVYTSQAPGCSAGNCLRQAVGCVHFPGLSHSGSGSRVLHKGVLCPSQVWAAQATRCLASALSPAGRCILSPPLSQLLDFLGVQQECHVSPLGISGCDSPGGCQPSRIPGRLGWQMGACSQFGRGCRLWGQDCPFLALAVTCLPLCLQRGMGQCAAG